MSQRIYVAIDLKSYYASLETIERGLDPLTTNLVVADPSRTAKTICLAVSPALRSFGIPGRPRLFQVIQKVKEINARRLQEAIRAKRAVRDENGRWAFSGKSADFLYFLRLSPLFQTLSGATRGEDRGDWNNRRRSQCSATSRLIPDF